MAVEPEHVLDRGEAVVRAMVDRGETFGAIDGWIAENVGDADERIGLRDLAANLIRERDAADGAAAGSVDLRAWFDAHGWQLAPGDLAAALAERGADINAIVKLMDEGGERRRAAEAAAKPKPATPQLAPVPLAPPAPNGAPVPPQNLEASEAQREREAAAAGTLHVLENARPVPADVDRYDLNDLGAAERLIATHGERLRYVHPWDHWLVYDGTRWRPDDEGTPALLHKDLLRDLHAAALAVRDEKRRAAIVRYVLASGSAGRVRSVLELARSERGVPVQPGELDADPLALNVANGTLDLRTGALRPHDRADLITKLAPVAYDPDAHAPRFDTFLDRIFAGDAETIAFVQRYAGYSLTGSTAEQKIAILWGTGANGKSTLIDTLRALLGEYGQQAPAETFLERRGERIPNDLARMHGARMVVAAEIGEGRRLNEPLVKQMTGGDPIVARRMRSEWFEFEPAFTPWLATNHKPEIRGVDLAIWRRVRLVPFTVTIPEAERDDALRAKLRVQLPGILNWALAGCLAWQRDGLGSSAAIDAATADYRDESDVLGGFIADCCVTGDGIKAKAGDLYARYVYWAAGAGVEPLKQPTFGSRLADRGFARDKTNALGRIWLGIGICHEQGHDA